MAWLHRTIDCCKQYDIKYFLRYCGDRPIIDILKIKKIIYKGQNSNIDSYSAFYDNAKDASTGFTDFLRIKKVEKVDFVGLATEYCVKFTALDSVSEGFYTRVITKCTKGLNEYDCKIAFDEMRDKGIVLI